MTAGPKVERRGIGTMNHVGGGTYEQTFDPDGPPRPTAGSTRTSSTSTSATSPPSASTATTWRCRRSPTTRCGPVLRPQGAPRGHGRQPRRGVAVLPDLPPLLRPDLHRGQRPRARARPASRPTTTGWSRSGAATPAAALIPLIIVPLWDVELAAAEVHAQRRARRPRRVRSARSRPTSGCRRSTPATGTRSSPPAHETGTVVCMHIGSSSPACRRRRPTRPPRWRRRSRFGNAMSVDERLACSPEARAVPRR